jgi:hypothetical protein
MRDQEQELLPVFVSCPASLTKKKTSLQYHTHKIGIFYQLIIKMLLKE